MKTFGLSEKKTPPTTRNSNLELYRILSMFFIVAHHYVVNSGLTSADGPIYANLWSFPSQFLLLLGAFGKIGINCFVLITGYFMCKSQITAKKFVKLLFEVMFYKIIIHGIFWISGYAPITSKAVLDAVLPFRSVAQNFTGTYILFFLCIPFLNILIHNLNKKQHFYLVLLSSFIYIVFGSVPILSVDMNYVSWYITLYFMASYIRLYPKKIYDNTKFWGWATLCCVLLSMASVVACSWVRANYNMLNPYYFVADSNKLLAVFTGLCSFMFFKNVNIKQSRVINTVSATTFGVLMIHANSATMRQWLWKDVCDNVGAYHSAWLPLHAVGCVIVIFAVCSLLDMLRIRFVETPVFAFWDKHYPSWAQKFTAKEDKWLKLTRENTKNTE